MSASKTEKLDIVRRLFLTDPNDWKAAEIAAKTGIPERAVHHYLNDLKESLVEMPRRGAYIYEPTQDEIEMSVLILQRALERHNITDEMVELAQAINHRQASV